ncbi:MAG: hypothetical protein JW918_17660 [Anaerolineae bacterium]|nr:hypothetical protein [Anaerolineae bacterium]
MKKRLSGFLLLFALALTLISPLHVAARPISQSISFLPQVTGPDAEGAYYIDGTYTASGLDPTGPNNNYYVDIYAEFIGPGGSWPAFYDSQDISKGCFTLGGSCLSDEQAWGDTLGSVTIHRTQLADHEDGMALLFGGDVAPPAGATEMRIVARLEHKWGVEWPAFYYAWAVHGPQSLTPPTQATPTPPPQPTPTSPSTPGTPGPCGITLSPSPAYVKPGEKVEIAGEATWADGQPITDALLTIDCGVLDGSGCVSPARTDAQGRFKFQYAAPPDAGGVTSVTARVTVEGCPITASVPINLGSSPTGGTSSGSCLPPLGGAAFIAGVVVLYNRKRQSQSL